MRFTFHGSAKTGTVTIQANASAFLPLASESSNTISIVVHAPLKSQSISFTTPMPMKVKDLDQSPKAVSTSGLMVVLTSNTPSICTIDFLKIHAVSAGTCSITATQNGNSNYSTAISVERTFTIIGVDLIIPNEPNPPVQEVTNLGSATYDPKNASSTYISVLVASGDSNPNKATLVKLLVPPHTTDAPVVFLISSFSSDEETAAGYFVARIKSTFSDGIPNPRLKKSIEINIPAGAHGSFPSWSFDGSIWYKLEALSTEELPTDLHAGYFVEKDGRIAILSDYLMLFGFKKSQLPLKIETTVLSMLTGSQVQIHSNGGSGTGAVTFTSRTLDVCTISDSGVVTGLLAGKCIISARKASAGIYANAISSAITIIVQSDVVIPNSSPDDLKHSIICQELSYTLAKSSALVYVDLCKEDAREIATLEIGTKSKAGIWSYKTAKRQVLDGNGVTLFKLTTPLLIGQIIRVRVEGKVQISTTVKAK